MNSATEIAIFWAAFTVPMVLFWIHSELTAIRRELQRRP